MSVLMLGAAALLNLATLDYDAARIAEASYRPAVEQPAPMSDLQLRAIHGRALPVVGTDHEGGAAAARSITIAETGPVPSQMTREVVDNWSFDATGLFALEAVAVTSN